MYLPTLTTDELLRYASGCAVTDLEKELTVRLTGVLDSPTEIELVADFKEEVFSIAEDVVDTKIKRTALMERLFKAIENMENSQA